MVFQTISINALRVIMLGIGPVLMIAASHATCCYFRPQSSNEVADTLHRTPHATADSIAVELRNVLGSGYSVAAMRPFVVAIEGDVDQLDRFCADLLTPAVAAIHHTLGIETAALEAGSVIYTVVAVQSDESLQRLAWRLDGRRLKGYTGYYLRDRRRLVADLSSGSGSLLHELVHATLHHHAPELPEWFDEGLATRFETAVLLETEQQLRLSQHAPRLQALRPAVNAGNLIPVTQLANLRRAETTTLRERYAHSAAFCMFLEDCLSAPESAQQHPSSTLVSESLHSHASSHTLIEPTANNNAGLQRLFELAVRSQLSILETNEHNSDVPIGGPSVHSPDHECDATRRLLEAVCAAGPWADVGKMDQAFRLWLEEQLSAIPASAAVELRAL